MTNYLKGTQIYNETKLQLSVCDIDQPAHRLHARPKKKTEIFHSLSLFCTVQHDILCEFLLLLSLLLSSQFLFVTPALKYIKTVITFTLNIFVCLQNNVLNVLLFFFFGFCQLFVGCIWQEMYTRNRNESHRNLMCVCVCRD